MKYRKLGRTGFDVSEVGYGAWGIGGKQWLGGNDKDSLAALRRALDQGVNFIDTALAYGDGKSEQLVGHAVQESNREVYVATKVPPKNRVWPARAGTGIEEVYPYEYILRSTDESLRNLGLDAIDLLQLHVWNPEWMGRDDWRRAFEDVKSAGKVRAVGISINAHQPDSALQIVESGLIDSVQVIYNIFDQTPQQSLFPACAKNHVGVIARVPFDEGSLAGLVNEKTTFPEGDFRNSYFRGDRRIEVAQHVQAIVDDLGLADATHLPGAALRFCLSNPAVSTVIPGMRSIANVDANVMAAGQGPLPESTLGVLREHAWNRNYYE